MRGSIVGRDSKGICNLCCVDVINDEAKPSTWDRGEITVVRVVVMSEEVFALFLLRSVAGVVLAVILWLGVRGNMVTLEVIDLLRLVSSYVAGAFVNHAESATVHHGILLLSLSMKNIAVFSSRYTLVKGRFGRRISAAAWFSRWICSTVIRTTATTIVVGMSWSWYGVGSLPFRLVLIPLNLLSRY